MNAQPADAGLLTRLSQTLAEANRASGETFVDFGPFEDGWTLASALVDDDAVLEAFLEEESFSSPTLDRRGRGAYLVGSISYRLSNLAVPFLLTQDFVPRIDLKSLAFRHERYSWEYEGESGQASRLMVRLLTSDHAQATDRETARDVLRADLEACLAQLSDRILAATKLSKAAQYRLAADSIASAFLYSARALGQEADGKAEALALIKIKGTPFNNPQTDFIDITVTAPDDPDKVLASETFRQRGGCCRYYTTEGGEYCSTCVLRKPDDIKTLLTDYLRTQLPAA